MIPRKREPARSIIGLASITLPVLALAFHHINLQDTLFTLLCVALAHLHGLCLLNEAEREQLQENSRWAR